jgi:hypothetical protein
MTAILRPFCFAAAVLAAGSLAAQAPECRQGPDDEKEISVSVATLAHPTRVAAALDSLLRVQGYVVTASPGATGSWSIEPRFTWLAEVNDEDWHGEEHPGVQLSVQTEARGDSTEMTLGARSLCKVPTVPGGPEDIGAMVELVSAMTLAAGVSESLDSARAAGIDPLTPVARPRTSVQAPETVAGFRMVGRHDFPDRRLGTTVRYAAADERYVDIYVYPGVRVDSACDAACAVNLEADGFVTSIPELVRGGRFEQLDAAGDQRFQPAAGAAWAYGRHLSLRGRSEGQAVESHYFLYSFPGFFLKVRATFPPSPDALAAVKAFVDELLGTLLTPSG